MIEAYRIGVSLVLDSNVTTVLAGLAKQFEVLDKTIKGLQLSVNELASGLRAMGRVSGIAGAWRDVADQVERAAKASRSMRGGAGGQGAGGEGPGPPPITPVFGAIVPPNRGAVGAAAAVGALVPFRSPIPLNLPSRQRPETPSTGDFTQAGVGLGLAAAGAGALVKTAFDAGADVAGVSTRMRQQGFSDDQIANSLAAAFQAQRQLGAVSILDAMKLQLDAAVLLRNPNEARDALGSLAQMMIVLRSLGKGEGVDALFQSLQAGELKGALLDPKAGKVSPERISKFLGQVEGITLATGGRIGPAEVLQFLKSSGLSGSVISDDALNALIPAMLSMGGARAGTGLNAVFQQFSAGRMSQGSFAVLKALGLVADPSKAQKWGIGQMRLLPGAMAPGAQKQFTDDPVAFVRDVLIPALHSYDMKTYGADDVNRQATTVQSLASRIPGGNLLADIIRLLPLSDAYKKAVLATGDRNAFDIRMRGDPRQATETFGNAVNALMVALASPNMGPAVHSLNDMTAAVNAITAWEQKNPNAARVLLDFAAALAVVGGAAAAAMVAIAPIMALIKVGKWAGVAAPEAAGAAARSGILGKVLGPIGLGLALYGATKDVISGGRELAGELGIGSGGKNGFDIWDRSTWADPKGSWLWAAPKPDGPKGTSADPFHVQGTVNVGNGRDLAAGVSAQQTKQASKPSSGPTSTDPRGEGPYQGLMGAY